MKGQVSIEFLILFLFAILAFFAAATAIPTTLGTNTAENKAKKLLDDIKLHLVTASTTQGTYTAEIPVPETLGGQDFNLTIHQEPDNVAVIYQDDSIIAQHHLPVITTVKDKAGVTAHVVINKTSTTEVYV